MNLKIISTFFKKELPSIDTVDLSKCELGFFSAAEALAYLTKFQEKFRLETHYYDEIFSLISMNLANYLGHSGCIEKYRMNKKIICEYNSFTIKLLEFSNTIKLNGNHTLIGYIPDLCYSLATLCPPDCYFLRRDSLRTIVNTFLNRKDLHYGLERYFCKNAFGNIEYDPLKIMVMYYLCDFLVIFGNMLPLTVYKDFDARITDYLPLNRNLALITACISSYKINLTYLQKAPLDFFNLQLFLFKQLKNVEKIYKLFHREVIRNPDGSIFKSQVELKDLKQNLWKVKIAWTDS